MADDKKNIPEAAPPTEAPAPAVENAAVLEQPSPGPALTDAEAVMLEHEGQAVLFEMGEAVPDPADAVTHAEVEEPAAPEVPKTEKEQDQPLAPGKDNPAPAHSGKVVNFAAARDEAAKEEKKAVKQTDALCECSQRPFQYQDKDRVQPHQAAAYLLRHWGGYRRSHLPFDPAGHRQHRGAVRYAGDHAPGVPAGDVRKGRPTF